MKEENLFKIKEIKIKMINKKAQIKIQQMAFMILAVFIFFVLVGLFIFSFLFSGLQRSALALQEKDTLLMVTGLANSPEFACGESFGGLEHTCIDGDKVMVLKDNINRYSLFWGVNNIIISQNLTGTVECTKGNYPNCDYIDVFSRGVSGFPNENFVTLCYKEQRDGRIVNTCKIAKLGIYYG